MSKKDKKSKTNNKLDKYTTCECHKDDCKSCKKNNNSSKDLF